MIEQAKLYPSHPVPAEVIEQAANEVADPTKIVDQAIAALSSDPGALFEPPVLDALRAIQDANPAEFSRLRSRAKKTNPALRLSELDRLLETDEGGHDGILERLIGLAKERCTLQHDKDQRGVAIVKKNTHQEVWYVRGSGFSQWLRAEYFNEYEKGVSETNMTAAIATIEAIGIHRGEEVDVHIRCAKDVGGYVIDICDARWRAIRIGPSGWEILERSPVLFTRNDKMRPLTAPVPGGDVDLLWKYVNVPEPQRELTLAWLLDAMRADTPYPILEIVGEQGSAKSTTQKFLRSLIDPNKVPLRGAPDSTEDIFIAAAASGIVSYENLSWLKNPMQDALCTLSTGGGYATRKFFTNNEEHVLETKRPVMLNSIAGVATRPDLIERTIRVDAPSIPQSERQEESELAIGWIEDAPKILGGLLDLFSKALQKLPGVKLPNRQRMADFERLGEAMMQARGAPAGAFSKLYAKAVKAGTELALESYGIVGALDALMASPDRTRGGNWSGTIGQLFVQLIDEGRGLDRSNWPRSDKGLGDQLRRLAPALRAKGLDIEIGERSSKGRKVKIIRREVEPDDVSSSQMSTTDTKAQSGRESVPIAPAIAASPEMAWTATKKKSSE